MFYKYILIALILGFSAVANADTPVTASCDDNLELDVAGYRWYDNGGAVADTVVSQAEFTVADGDHLFVVTCYDTSGNESLASLGVPKTYDTAAPGQPQNFLVSP